MTLIDQWQTWQYAQSLSVRTITERTSVLRRITADTGQSGLTLEAVHIARWLANDSWAPRTRWSYHQCLTAWFVWLQKQGHRPDNPMMMIGKPRRPRSEPRPITNHDLVRLLSSSMRRRSRAMVHLAAFQGLRVHEIAKVKGEHLDLVGRTITVTGKGGTTATLPLHHRVQEIAYLMPRQGYWFPGPDNGHQRRESVSNTIKQVMIRAGVTGSAHQLRHWFGTALLEAGVDLRTVQTLMRHHNLSSTAIYTLVSDSRRAQGIQKLDPFTLTAVLQN